jgi:hypothetical protein
MTFALALALVVAIAALAGASLRGARALGAEGLALPVAAAPLACSAAVLEALALGLLGLGGSAIALTAGAVLTWVLAARRWPAPVALPAARELAAWWVSLTSAERLTFGAVAGAGVAWVCWLVLHPGLGIDPLTYHLPESVIWVQDGHPGSVETLQYEFPQGYYPVTNEVLVAWLSGIAWTPVPALLWTSATALLAVTAGWLGLRRIGGGRLVSALAMACVLLAPIASSQLIGPHTDLPSLAWLWVAAALVAVADERPGLLGPAVLAIALAVGTKTTTAPLAVVLLGIAAWRHRAGLRPLAPLLGAALAIGVGVGGIWYLRNLVVHGSPLWPFRSTPFGDPEPAFIRPLDVSFIERPRLTLDRHADVYLKTVAGALVVLGLGLMAPLLRPERRVVAAWAATLVGLASWVTAPFTGAADDLILDLSAVTTRYLLPTFSAAAVAIVLAAEAGPRRRLAVAGGLMAGCVWSVAESHGLTLVFVPSTGILVAGALGGAAIAAVLGPALGRVRPVRAPRLAAVTLSCVLAVLLAGASHGFAARQGHAHWLRSTGLVSWAAEQPEWLDGSFRIAFAPEIIGILAGERLQHEIALVGRTESCASIAARARRGWVVLGTFPFPERREPFTAARCLRRSPPGTRMLYRDPLYTVFGLSVG